MQPTFPYPIYLIAAVLIIIPNFVSSKIYVTPFFRVPHSPPIYLSFISIYFYLRHALISTTLNFTTPTDMSSSNFNYRYKERFFASVDKLRSIECILCMWWRTWWRHCATDRKVAGSIPIRFLPDSGALGSTQPLT